MLRRSAAVLQRRAQDVAQRRARVGRAILCNRLLLFGDLHRLEAVVRGPRVGVSGEGGSVRFPWRFHLAGDPSVSAYRRPRIAIISSGEELVSSPTELAAGQLPDSNGPMLAALAGADAHVHVGDAPADLASALDELASSHDLIITSGGVSAGAFDVVHTVLGRTDSAWFGHVDQRPGAPQGYSLWNDTPVLCLPGNPVAAFVDFQLYARPLIAALSGHPAPRQRVNLRARVDSPLPASRGRPTIVPVTVDFQAAPAITSHLPHGSHRVVSLAGTNGFCLIDSEPPAMGEDITVYLY